MTRVHVCWAASVLLAALLVGCGEDGAADTTGASSGTSAGGSGPTGGAGGGVGGGDVGGSTGSGGYGGTLECGEVKAAAESYLAAHPGKEADINEKTPEELAADPAAQALMALCGPDQRPIIPLIAWEYGGSDHAWIMPEASALYYCVYIPVDPATENWAYDAATDHVEADVTIGCPEQNPCNDEQGADQVMACLGDETNIEIVVDLASLNDGHDAGLRLSESTTDLYLVLSDGMKVHLYTGL